MDSTSTQPRLLVVDDVEDNRSLLRRRFTRLGYEVLEAADGAKALAMVSTYPFDLVLLDIMMPGIDGLEVLRRLREAHSEVSLPVIMVTAKSASEDVVEALLMGANDYISKPVDMEVAAVRVEMQLRRKFAEDASRAAHRELERTLAGLSEAVQQAEHRAAILPEAGADARGPLTGVLGAASVLTRVCDTPELKRMIASIENARSLLDRLILDSVRPGAMDRRERPAYRRIKVLLADSDVDRRTLARSVFADAGVPVEVVEMASGASAAETAIDRAFDLLLINIDMEDGLAAVKKLRRREAERTQRRRPILALSSESRTGPAALDAGADLHAVLPISTAGLLTALARALRRESEDLTAAA
ncbi:MAG: response regulator [Alphaproteobacteria bacterium]|nr:response regulator [Alphaproteobacteria bacterium]